MIGRFQTARLPVRSRAKSTIPEFQLAVACCRPQQWGRDSEPLGIRQARIDWSLFLEVVARHRVAGLVDQGLCRIEVAAPAEVRAKLSADARAIRTQNLLLAGAMIRLDRGFRDTGVDHLFIKGLTLGQLAYHDCGLKMGWDIDLLVDRSDLARSAELLTALGYELRLPEQASTAALLRWHESSKESIWVDAAGVHVELHTRLADNRALIPALGLRSPRQAVAVAGHRFETLAADELIAYLCVHGASSAWFRLKWIADLTALLAPFTVEESYGLYDRAIALGAGRAAGQGFLLTHVLFGLPLSAQLLEMLANDRSVSWLARKALDSLAGAHVATELTDRLLGTLDIHLTQLALLPGWRFSIGEARRQLAAAMKV